MKENWIGILDKIKDADYYNSEYANIFKSINILYDNLNDGIKLNYLPDIHGLVTLVCLKVPSSKLLGILSKDYLDKVNSILDILVKLNTGKYINMLNIDISRRENIGILKIFSLRVNDIKRTVQYETNVGFQVRTLLSCITLFQALFSSISYDNRIESEDGYKCKLSNLIGLFEDLYDYVCNIMYIPEG